MSTFYLAMLLNNTIFHIRMSSFAGRYAFFNCINSNVSHSALFDR